MEAVMQIPKVFDLKRIDPKASDGASLCAAALGLFAIKSDGYPRGQVFAGKLAVQVGMSPEEEVRVYVGGAKQHQPALLATSEGVKVLDDRGVWQRELIEHYNAALPGASLPTSSAHTVSAQLTSDRRKPLMPA
jgi:hypothetical protein